jgi:hypothetical protein
MHKLRLSSVGVSLARLLSILGSHGPLLGVDAATPTAFENLYDSDGTVLFGVTI